MIYRVILVAGLLVAPLYTQAKCYGDQTRASAPLIFAPVPQLPAPTLFARWLPVLEAVGTASNECFNLVIKSSIPEFEKYLLTGAPDIAYVNPYHAVIAHNTKGYKPLLADGSMLLTGILVANKEGSIKNLSDLEGQRVDFPAPNSFAASLLLRAHLAQLKIHIKPQYVKTHSNVYRGIIIGDAVAGGGVNKTLEAEPEEIKQKIHVIYETPGYRSHPIVTNPRLSNATRLKILNSFVTLSKTTSGQELLTGVQLNSPIPVTYSKDYRPLEQLGLEKLVVLDD